jgi:hypothetical protein
MFGRSFGHVAAEGSYRLYKLKLLVVLRTSVSLHNGVQGCVRREIGLFWK